MCGTRGRPQYDQFPMTYRLICPQRSEARYIEQYYATIVQFFNTNHGQRETWFWSMLASPTPEVERIQHYHPKPHAYAQSFRLDRLPTEILGKIIDTLDLIRDENGDVARWSILALSLSSPLLYTKVLDWIHRNYSQRKGSSWAGQRIGFHGWLSFFDQSQQFKYGVENIPSYDGVALEMVRFERVSGEPENNWLGLIEFVKYKKLWENEVVDTSWKQIKKDFKHDWKYSMDQVWVLRNLTTREYVRSDGLKVPKNINSDPKLSLPIRLRTKSIWNGTKAILKCDFRRFTGNKKRLTLPQVFLVMTAQSNTALREHPFLIHDGPWTGHAFDLVPLQEHLSDEAGGSSDPTKLRPWRDATRAVAADVYHLRWCVYQYRNIWGDTKCWRQNTELQESVTKARLASRARQDIGNCRDVER